MKKPQSQRPGPVSTLAPNVEAINIGGARQTKVADTAPAPTEAPAKKAVTVRLDTSLIAQAHATVLATQARAGGYDSFNAMVEVALLAEVEKAAKKFNDGDPFPALEGKFRRGRPLKSN